MKLSEVAQQLENQLDVTIMLAIVLLRRLGGKVEFGQQEIVEARKYSIKRGISLEEGKFSATTVLEEPDDEANPA